MEMKQADPFYKSKRWLHVRDQALKRDEYICQQSKRYGLARSAEMVHHILPRELFPEYQYCLWNLISLTNKEHDKLHDRASDKLTAEGMRLVRKLARDRGLSIEALEQRLGA
jgi:5-methylcytosine-specific restriction endonuclease McrA